jgi:hypothetical protein
VTTYFNPRTFNLVQRSIGVVCNILVCAGGKIKIILSIALIDTTCLDLKLVNNSICMLLRLLPRRTYYGRCPERAKSLATRCMPPNW